MDGGHLMRDIKLEGTKFALRFSFNAICDIEEKTGKSITEILDFGEGETPPMSLVRTLVWAGLRSNHEEMTELGAGDVIDAVGIEGTMKALEAALAAAFPQDKPGNAPKGKSGQTG